MQYLKVKNWKKFQHYKKRNPPWIKLYSWVLDDDDFDCLPDDSKLLFFCLLVFASRRKNEIKLDFGWLQKKLPIHKKLTRKMLQPLINADFIECYQVDSETIADCKQDAMPEESREETEREGEKSKNKYLDFVFLTEEEYKKLVEEFGKSQTAKFIYKLNNYVGSSGHKYNSHYHAILGWVSDSEGGKSLPTSEDNAEKQKKQREADKERLRKEYKGYLKDKTTKALKDLKADGGHLAGLCGWLIDEILAERSAGKGQGKVQLER